MTARKHPLRSTIAYGLLAALFLLPLVSFFGLLLPGGRALAAAGLLLIAGYGLLLAAWSGNGRRRGGLMVFLLPLVVLLGHGTPALFWSTALVALAWYRSFFLFGGRLLVHLPLELMLCGGGWFLATTCGLGGAAGPLTLMFGVFLFFLVQSLYFVVGNHEGEGEAGHDPFEAARRRAEAVLGPDC